MESIEELAYKVFHGLVESKRMAKIYDRDGYDPSYWEGKTTAYTDMFKMLCRD